MPIVLGLDVQKIAAQPLHQASNASVAVEPPGSQNNHAIPSHLAGGKRPCRNPEPAELEEDGDGQYLFSSTWFLCHKLRRKWSF